MKDVVPEDIDNEKKPPGGLKWIRRIGLGFFLVAILLALLAFLPSASPSSPEPGWLAKMPTASSEQKIITNKIYFPSGGYKTGPEVLIDERLRFVEMPFEEFVTRLNEDWRGENGWKFYRPRQGNSASWSKTGPEGAYAVWIVGDSNRIRVNSTYTHEVTWAEKASHWVKGVFGR